MLLSQEFKKRLLELAGVSAGQNLISEADKRGVITGKLKIPKEIADWAHNLSEKYSIWIADSAKKSHLKNAETWVSDDAGSESLEELKKAWELKNLSDAKTPSELRFANMIQEFAKLKTGDYQYILDWLKGRGTLAPEHDQINFKTLTFDEAKKRSKDWHDNLAAIQGGKIEGEQGEVVMTFPEGFYWIKIGKDYCPEEAKAMGHCGRAAGTTLYSLRREQYPYVTAAVKEETFGIVTQMKGRANTKPKAQFHKYIIPFIVGNNPDITYFQSTYNAQTDFNISDLSETELVQVVNKKPSLLMGDGIIAIKKLPEQEVKKLLVNHPEIFKYEFISDRIQLSDILRNKEMVDWAIANAPKLFWMHNWGTVKFDTEQLHKALASEVLTEHLYIDQMNLDKATLNWIVINRPNMFNDSIHTLEILSDEQKDYLVKNHPNAFRFYLSRLKYDDSNYDKAIVKLLGADRLRVLFVKEPGMFAQQDVSRISYYVFGQFMTPELADKYIKSHSESDDPLRIFAKNNYKRLHEFSNYINQNTSMYLLAHYPESFYASGMIGNANKEGGDAIGRYIVDHHFDWLTRYNYKLNIFDWKLTPAQKQKIVDSDTEGKTSILYDYNAEELQKINLSTEQKKQLIDIGNTEPTIDMLEGFKFKVDRTGNLFEPAVDEAENLILKLLESNPDEHKRIINIIDEMYGEEYLKSLYIKHKDAFDNLYLIVKLKDVKELKKYDSKDVSYTNEGVKIRFDDWTDTDLLDLFDDPDVAKRIANYELDYYGHNYSFEDIDNNFDELDQVNTARVKYLITKAFPKEFKKTIQAMSHSQLVNILNDPDSISEEPIDYNGDIIDEIKNVFTRSVEDAQRNADENEYWKLFLKPIKDFFGEPEWATIKVKKKGEDKVEEKNMLEFKLSYGEIQELIKDAETEDYSSEEGSYPENEAGYLIKIIKMALQHRGEEFEIDEPHYGVSGDINKDDLNEHFNELLYENDEFSELLDKAKITVKKQPKKK